MQSIDQGEALTVLSHSLLPLFPFFVQSAIAEKTKDRGSQGLALLCCLKGRLGAV